MAGQRGGPGAGSELKQLLGGSRGCPRKAALSQTGAMTLGPSPPTPRVPSGSKCPKDSVGWQLRTGLPTRRAGLGCPRPGRTRLPVCFGGGERAGALPAASGGPALTRALLLGRGGRLLHSGARDPAAQDAQAEPTGRGPGLELQVPALLTRGRGGAGCHAGAAQQGRRGAAGPRPQAGGQNAHGPPRTWHRLW